MRLLGSIVSYQRWGIARARPRGWALYFKGGWVRGIENQVGLLRRGERRVAVAVFTSGQSAAYGRQTEREVARRLLRGLRPDSVPALGPAGVATQGGCELHHQARGGGSQVAPVRA